MLAQAKNHQRQLQEILDDLAALTDPKSSDGLRFRLDLYFGEVEIKGDHDFEAQDTLLDFEADEGLSFRVRVTREYDADYASGQIAVDLSILGKMLRSSVSRNVRISTKGVISN